MKRKDKHKNKITNLLQFIHSFNNQRCNTCSSILAKHFDRIYCSNCKK